MGQLYSHTTGMLFIRPAKGYRLQRKRIINHKTLIILMCDSGVVSLTATFNILLIFPIVSFLPTPSKLIFPPVKDFINANIN
jgi:hypothetical protein